MSYLDGGVRRVIFCVTRSSHNYGATFVNMDDLAEVYHALGSIETQQRSGSRDEARQL